MTPENAAAGSYPQAMKTLWLAALLSLPVPCSAAGSAETARLAARTLETPAAASSGDESFSEALLRRQEAFAQGAVSECGGRQGCGRQVSAHWVAGRQVDAVARTLEETVVERYGLRGWGRELMSDTDSPLEFTMAAAAGAVLLAADGLRARKRVAGIDVRLRLAAARRFADRDAALARVELGKPGLPLTLSASYTRRTPWVGLGYTVRY